MKAMMRTMVVALCLASGGAALAQSPPTSAPAAAAKDAEGFEQVNGDMMQSGETIPGNRMVGLAYGFICVALIAYVVSVARRARKLEDEVDALKKKLG